MPVRKPAMGKRPGAKTMQVKGGSKFMGEFEAECAERNSSFMPALLPLDKLPLALEGLLSASKPTA